MLVLEHVRVWSILNFVKSPVYIFFVTDTDDFNVSNVVIPQGGIPVTTCASVMATQDGLAEGDHDFSINIDSTNQPVSVTVVMPDTTSVIITDDDGML